MASLVPDNIRKLLTQYSFEIDSKSSDVNLSCIICRKLMNDAYMSTCGCQYCHQCIVSYLDSENKYCLGGKVECRNESLILNQNVMRSASLNRQILEVKVLCPNKTCAHSSILAQMEEHLRICIKQIIECPYSIIGCNTEIVSKDTIAAHMHNDTFTHTQLLIENIRELRNEFKMSREEVLSLKTKISEQNNEMECLRKDFVNKENKIERELVDKENRIAIIERQSVDKERTQEENMTTLLRKVLSEKYPDNRMDASGEQSMIYRDNGEPTVPQEGMGKDYVELVKTYINQYKSTSNDPELVTVLRSLAEGEYLEAKKRELTLLLSPILTIFNEQYKENIFNKILNNKPLSAEEHSKTTCLTLSIGAMGQCNEASVLGPLANNLTEYLIEFADVSKMNHVSSRTAQIFLFSLSNICRNYEICHKQDILADKVYKYFTGAINNDKIKLPSAYLSIFFYNRGSTMNDENMNVVIEYVNDIVEKMKKKNSDLYVGFCMGTKERDELRNASVKMQMKILMKEMSVITEESKNMKEQNTNYQAQSESRLKTEGKTIEVQIEELKTQIKILKKEMESLKHESKSVKCSVATLDKKSVAYQQETDIKIRHIIDESENNENDVRGRFNNIDAAIERIDTRMNMGEEVGVTKLTVDKYNLRKTAKERVTSPFFYSHTNGYKLRLYVHPGGYGRGCGTHLSAMVIIVKGENDEQLPWPCKHTFIISIINQHSGETQHSFTRNYDTATVRSKTAFSRPTDKVNASIGYDEFISHSDLSSIDGLLVDEAVIIKCSVNAPK